MRLSDDCATGSAHWIQINPILTQYAVMAFGWITRLLRAGGPSSAAVRPGRAGRCPARGGQVSARRVLEFGGGVLLGRKLPVGQVLVGESVELLKSFPEKSVDLIFADPPYNLQLSQELYRPNMTRVDGVDEAWDQFDSFRGLR